VATTIREKTIMLAARFALSLILFSAISVSLAQEPNQTNPNAARADSGAGPPSRTIWISAHDKNGAASELLSTDLEAKLDGKPASVTDFRRVNPTLHYCLLLDDSGSTRPARSRQHDEAVAILSKLPKPGRDYGLLINFSNQAYLDAEGTDPQKLIKGINQESRGATAMYDAMVACSDYLSRSNLPDQGSDTLRVMFVLSDGVDNASSMTREGVERILLSGAIRIYSIGEEDGGSYGKDQAAKANKSLKQLVESTGGKSYPLSKNLSIDEIVHDISSDLSSLYGVSLSAPPGHMYKLEVRCKKTNCAVAAPREYFARN
jgi:VWFA-related protein